ncbi:MBL fold metallo-hydrolase [Candidatus Beckwithbacteria bacterium]|nr:MBL fold metallo-hydrolase [Candidatus Beckwithbacteria bacterium]
MNKYLSNIIIILLLGLFLAVSYLYVPNSVYILNQKIEKSQPLQQDEARQNLVSEYGQYLAKNLPENTPKLYFYWLSNQRKLSNIRVKQAIAEIKSEQVVSGKIKAWTLLNMGVVIKTNSKIIAIDTANLPFSQAHNELARITDVFLVTHLDGDHFDSSLLKKAIANNKKVVLPEGFLFDSSQSENIIKLNSGESRNINGVTITAYQTDHRGDGNFNDPSVWFKIKTDGFTLLHTGDGRDFKNKNEANKVYQAKDYDILLGNILLHPYNIRDLKPHLFIPLHLFKFMSGNDLYQQSTIEVVQSNYQNYTKDLQGINIVYLLPGEGFTYPAEN